MYLGKDYVEGKADQLQPSQIILNHPKNLHDTKEQPFERGKFVLIQT